MRTKYCFRLLVSLLLACGICVEVEAAKEIKDWTFLVFLNGHNSLDSYGPMNIKQMEKVGSNENLNIIVQWASMNQETKRLYVTKSTDPNRVTSPIVDRPGVVDMGDYHNLVEFVRWGVANYPAKHYFLNVWDHGSGWHLRLNQLGAIAPKDISEDDRFGHIIKTEQLGIAMREIATIIGHKLDIFGSDACLMQMAEVVGELQDSVQVVVGSEEVEPAQGWPYDDFLAAWVAEPNADAERIGTLLVQKYLAAYSGGQYGNMSVTYSAVRTYPWSQFIEKMRNLAVELIGMPATESNKLLQAAKNTQNYNFLDYRDIVDFTNKLEAANVLGIQYGTIADARNAVQSLVIANGVSPQYANSHGFSFWMPTSNYYYGNHCNRYHGLAFHQATTWGNVMETYLSPCPATTQE